MYGYNFKGSHVRLGSKVHIEDFIYAKRMLQNSHYAIRFAFILAKHIAVNCIDLMDPPEERAQKTCILCYGLYSELLASNTARFLKLMRPGIESNHSIIGDVDTGKIEHAEYLENSKIIIVIPVASTLSTATKIMDSLTQFFKQNKNGQQPDVVGRAVNLILVGHNNLEDITDDRGIVIDAIASHYWKKVILEHRRITVKAPHKEQDFLLYLPSRWHLQSNCTLCHPENDLDEKPLVLTDRESLSPAMIFGIPKGKKLPDTPTCEVCFGDDQKPYDDKGIIDSKMLRHLHVVRGSNHYRYYLDTDRILGKNEGAIVNWCKEVRRNLSEGDNKDAWVNKRKFIIAPSHTTNAKFISILNSIVFEGAATIFYYKPNEDFEENIALFFLQQITKESFVYFADDALCSAGTFHQVQDLLKSMSELKMGLSGAFVLLNRLNREKQDAVLRDLKDENLFAFINIEAPVIGTTKDNCYLCKERERYYSLISHSTLDCLRERWRETLKEKIRIFDHTAALGPPSKFGEKKSRQARHLRRLECTHKIYRLGRDNPELFSRIFNPDAGVDVKSLSETIDLPSKGQDNKQETKAAVFKALSLPHFIFYHHVRCAVFKWALTETNRTMENIATLAQSSIQSADVHIKLPRVFRYLKLLFNRLQFLGSNFPLRHGTIVKLNDIIENCKTQVESWTQPVPLEGGALFEAGQKQIEEERKQTRDRFLPSIERFNIYYTSIVKALVDEDEGKSLFLEKNIERLFTANLDQSSSFYSLLRMIRLENATILRNYIEWIDSLGYVEEYIIKINNSISFSYGEMKTKLWNKMKQADLWNHYRGRQILGFLSIGIPSSGKTDDEINQREFIVPLLFCHFNLKNAENDNFSYDPSDDQFLSRAMGWMCSILGNENSENSPYAGGAVCLARCGETPEGEPDMDQVASTVRGNKTLLWCQSLANEVLKGKKTKENHPNWSNVEICRSDENPQIFFDYKKNIYKSESYEELRNSGNLIKSREKYSSNHFLFVRLPTIDFESDVADTLGGGVMVSKKRCAPGVLVVFSDDKRFFDEKKLRLVMIMRNMLGKYVSKRFDNDNFRAILQRERRLNDLLIMDHGLNRELKVMGEIIKDFSLVPIENQNVAELKSRCDFLIGILDRKKKYMTETLKSDGSKVIMGGLKQIAIGEIEKTFNQIKNLGLYLGTSEIDWNFECNDFKKDASFGSCDYLVNDALFELIRNSIEKAPSGRRTLISIKILKENSVQRPILVVEDNGNGVDPSTLKSLNQCRFPSENRGLKMFSLLWEMVFKGKMHFESEEGKYFSVHLPLFDVSANPDCKTNFKRLHSNDKNGGLER